MLGICWVLSKCWLTLFSPFWTDQTGSEDLEQFLKLPLGSSKHVFLAQKIADWLRVVYRVSTHHLLSWLVQTIFN